MKNCTPALQNSAPAEMSMRDLLTATQGWLLTGQIAGCSEMSLVGLLTRLRALGATITAIEGILRVGPSQMYTDPLRRAIMEHRSTLMELQLPYKNQFGGLVIPTNAPPQYHWQPLAKTLAELNAPSHVIARYVGSKKVIEE